MREPTNILFDCLTGTIGSFLYTDVIEDIVRENNKFDRSYGNRSRKYSVDRTAEELRTYFQDELEHNDIDAKSLADLLCSWALYGCVTLEERQSITFDNIDWNKLAKLLITEYVD